MPDALATYLEGEGAHFMQRLPKGHIGLVSHRYRAFEHCCLTMCIEVHILRLPAILREQIQADFLAGSVMKRTPVNREWLCALDAQEVR
jgi:hypothetical protein